MQLGHPYPLIYSKTKLLILHSSEQENIKSDNVLPPKNKNFMAGGGQSVIISDYEAISLDWFVSIQDTTTLQFVPLPNAQKHSIFPYINQNERTIMQTI